MTQRSASRPCLFFVCLFVYMFVCFWCDSSHCAKASSFTRFLDHTKRRTTVGRTPLDEWSAHRRGLYLTTHNSHNRQISMPQMGFEPTISAGERPQTFALDRAATGTGTGICYWRKFPIFSYRKFPVLSYRKFPILSYRKFPIFSYRKFPILSYRKFPILSYRKFPILSYRNCLYLILIIQSVFLMMNLKFTLFHYA